MVGVVVVVVVRVRALVRGQIEVLVEMWSDETVAERASGEGHARAQVTSNHVRSRQVTSGHVRSRQVTSNHVKSRHVKPGQAQASQISSIRAVRIEPVAAWRDDEAMRAQMAEELGRRHARSRRWCHPHLSVTPRAPKELLDLQALLVSPVSSVMRSVSRSYVQSCGQSASQP